MPIRTSSALRFSLVTPLLAIGTLTLAQMAFAQDASIGVWDDIGSKSLGALEASQEGLSQVPLIERSRKLWLNETALKGQLGLAHGKLSGVGGPTIDLPLPDGGFATYRLYEAPIMAPGLAARFPDIKTFKVVGVDNNLDVGRLDIGPKGFHGAVSYGGESFYIDPVGVKGAYQSYYTENYVRERGGKTEDFICHLGDHERFSRVAGHEPHSSRASGHNSLAQRVLSFGTDVRTYRLAVATTGEYAEFHGGTKASVMAEIVTAINRVNEIYERDHAIKLELIANNEDVIYLDAATDPFTNNDGGVLIDEVWADLDAKIGVANYDIGHVFSTGGGGVAYLGSVCSSVKGGGVTGLPQPTGDFFYIDFVSHEMGHQFGGEHTFNGTASNCGPNRSASAAYEPGSGTTILSYAGICGAENVQNEAGAYFHIHTIGQVNDFITNAARGGSCGTLSSLSNVAPVVNAGDDGAIPANTPFLLTGSATDADAGDSLTFGWEQYDLGAASSSPETMVDDGTRPIFRSFPPTSSPSRTFPQMSDVLSGTSTLGEALPTTERNLNFRLTVRDGQGGVASDDRVLSVSANAGPFVVTSPGADSWTGQDTQQVSWNIANTNAAPINCANVEISLSTDGGQTFGTQILASTPNDGSEMVTVPDLEVNNGRVRVMCASQPFFNISSGALSIMAAGPNRAPTAVDDSFTVRENAAAANFAVLGNDTDPDSDTLSLASVGTPSQGGTVSISGSEIRYQPAGGFSGTESFTYEISDGRGGSDMATVTMTITANQAPVANDDTHNARAEDPSSSIDVLANDTDGDSDTLTLTSVSTPNQGGTATISNGQISYQPAAGFSGTESFTYNVEDGFGGSASATVTVTVAANQAPVANNDSFTVQQNSASTTFNVLNNDTDPESDSLTIVGVGTSSQNGLTSTNGTTVTYRPPTGFSGTDSFTYEVSDGRGGSDSATVSVTVRAASTGGGGSSGGGGGGIGSFGLVMLGLLGLTRFIKRVTRRARRAIAE